MIRGIPTVYSHVRFRSRLEAKWAAMFDALGWRWEYEPFDLPGWIPDFLLPDANMLVEVKPVDRFPADVAAKAERALPRHCTESYDGLRMYLDYEAMILGHSCPVDSSGFDSSDGRAIGWMLANPMLWHPEQNPMWGRAIVQKFQEGASCISDPSVPAGFGLYHEHDSEMRSDPGWVRGDRWDISHCAGNRFRRFRQNQIIFWEVYTPASDTGFGQQKEKCVLTNLWRESSNKVHWLAKRQ